jgi:hypothetical protein
MASKKRQASRKRKAEPESEYDGSDERETISPRKQARRTTEGLATRERKQRRAAREVEIGDVENDADFIMKDTMVDADDGPSASFSAVRTRRQARELIDAKISMSDDDINANESLPVSYLTARTRELRDMTTKDASIFTSPSSPTRRPHGSDSDNEAVSPFPSLPALWESIKLPPQHEEDDLSSVSGISGEGESEISDTEPEDDLFYFGKY